MNFEQFKQLVASTPNLNEEEKQILMQEVEAMDEEKKVAYFEILLEALGENEKIDRFSTAFQATTFSFFSQKVKEARKEAEAETFTIAKKMIQENDASEMESILNELGDA
jgi:hypothetical protein